MMVEKTPGVRLRRGVVHGRRKGETRGVGVAARLAAGCTILSDLANPSKARREKGPTLGRGGRRFFQILSKEPKLGLV